MRHLPGVLLAAAALSGCTAEPVSSPLDSAALPDFQPPSDAPAWIGLHRDLFFDRFGLFGGTRQPAWGRVVARYVTAPDTAGWPCTRDHGDAAWAPESTRLYLQVIHEAGGVRLLPACTGTGTWQGHGEPVLAAASGRWTIRAGAFEPGNRVLLSRDDGARLEVQVERWQPERAESLAAWSAWAYTRALIAANLAGHDVELQDMLATPPPLRPLGWEARGSALAVLIDAGQEEPVSSEMALARSRGLRDVRIRRRLTGGAWGYWGDLCMYADSLDWARATHDDIRMSVAPRVEQLRAWGEDVDRFLVGAALTMDGGFLAPVPVRELVKVMLAVGDTTVIGAQIGSLLDEPGLHWANRVRLVAIQRALAARDPGALMPEADWGGVEGEPFDDAAAVDLRCVGEVLGDLGLCG